ncbi:hypothetical protein MICAB_370006 [Microcystis aeruginosa PCC 9717]|uniref:Uncharacterized protein n=1 Tax=Microcystis aeruginosa PCC 9717 TaxID=1160286 RepID=I4FQ17_MICAE|nr:hypothetical protein MICAB_370006 [Microcystis aeruginosa PCC 9717]
MKIIDQLVSQKSQRLGSLGHGGINQLETREASSTMTESRLSVTRLNTSWTK